MKLRHYKPLLGICSAFCCLTTLPEWGMLLSATAEPSELEVTTTEIEENLQAITSEELNLQETITTTAPMAEVLSESTSITMVLDDVFLGDMNENGKIEVEDAVLILDAYARISVGLGGEFNAQQIFYADCNKDSSLTVEDAVFLLEYYALRSANVVTVPFYEYVFNPPQTTTTTTTTSTTTTTTVTTTTTEESTETTATTSITEVTSTTSETITTTTTMITTTTTLPERLELPVSCILQNASPSLPTGCEATALTIALNYDGFSVDKNTIAQIYLPKMVFCTLNGLNYGADFQYVFPGDPTTSYGYGCYAPAITATANAYFTAQKSASYAKNITGTSFTDLFTYLAEGRPVVFWATMGMCAPGIGKTWTTPDGKSVTWLSNEHCLVLIGYDKTAGTVLVADPLKGVVSYDSSLVQQRYEQMGSNAVILHKSTEAKGEVESVISGSVYRLRNAESGHYLTVANGTDADGTNLIQQAGGDSLSQQFRLIYDAELNAYRLYVMCSSDGGNRVVDIIKIGGGVVSGCNVEIYRPVDAPAQTFVIEPQDDGTMRISCRTNRNACLAVTNTAEGSASGTSYYSDGNAVIQNYTGAGNQRWYLELISE